MRGRGVNRGIYVEAWIRGGEVEGGEYTVSVKGGMCDLNSEAGLEMTFSPGCNHHRMHLLSLLENMLMFT